MTINKKENVNKKELLIYTPTNKTIIRIIIRNKEKNINNKKKEKIIKEYIKKTVKHGKRQKKDKKII